MKVIKLDPPHSVFRDKSDNNSADCSTGGHASSDNGNIHVEIPETEMEGTSCPSSDSELVSLMGAVLDMAPELCATPQNSKRYKKLRGKLQRAASRIMHSGKAAKEKFLHPEDKFILESLEDAETVSEYVGEMLRGVETGKVVLMAENDELLLEPAPLLKFKVKARKRQGSCKLTFSISWKELRDNSETDDVPED